MKHSLQNCKLAHGVEHTRYYQAKVFYYKPSIPTNDSNGDIFVLAQVLPMHALIPLSAGSLVTGY